MLFQFRKCQFKIIFNIFSLKFRKQRCILSPVLLNFNSNLNFSTLDNKLHSYPLHDIKNLNYEVIDKKLWFELIDQLSKAQDEGKNLPSSLKLKEIDELLRLESYKKRYRYLNFLFKKEQKKLADKEKRVKKQIERETSNVNTVENNHINYGIGKNTLLLGTRRSSFLSFYKKRLANSILFGQNIVIDLGYDEYMWNKERRDCAAQLRLLYSVNRSNIDPYNLYFCNAKSLSYCFQYLREEMPNIDDSLISITEQSYLDIFPKEKLVYLSPHASETLEKYDHKAIYIIGGFVDTVKREHISLQKSEREGIKSYSLPLDKYILWGDGSKSLSINQVFQIIITLRDTGDWIQALKHVPSRKIRSFKIENNSSVPDDKLFLFHTSKSKICI